MAVKSARSIKVVRIMKRVLFVSLFIFVLEYSSRATRIPSLIGYYGFEVALVSILIIILSIFAILGAVIADRAVSKGRSWSAFFWLSMLFSPLIMFVIVSTIQVDQSQLTVGVRSCPKCAEPVKIEAILCKHCGSDIQ
jgi:hypothetical protein